VTPVNFLNRSLIRHTFLECESHGRGMRSVRRRLRMEEYQSRPCRDHDEASCGYAKKESDKGAQIKEARAASGFLLHCRWMNFEPPLVAQMPDECQTFSCLSGVFLERRCSGRRSGCEIPNQCCDSCLYGWPESTTPATATTSGYSKPL
jgi:hypothetical protein